MRNHHKSIHMEAVTINREIVANHLAYTLLYMFLVAEKMNLLEKLLRTDAKKTEELQTGVFKSARLAKLLGETKPVEVQIREIPSRRINDIAAYQVKDNGNLDLSKSFDASLMTCVEGCMEPDLRNEELQKHFNCADARSLAEKLFGGEVKALSDAIINSSNYKKTEENTEDAIKN